MSFDIFNIHLFGGNCVRRFFFSLSIYGDYDEVVGNNKTILEEMWTVEIAETLSIPVTSIYNLTISRGKYSSSSIGASC